MKNFLIKLSILCTFAVMSMAAWGAPIPGVKLEPRSGSMSDTFQLAVTLRDAEVSGKAKFDDNADFSITFSGTTRGVQIINGDINQQNSLLFRLEPLHTGTLSTPEITIPTSAGDVLVSPIEVKVGEGGSQEGHDVALEQTISSTKVFQDQQVLQTVEILTAEELHSIRFDTPSYNGFLVEEIKPEERDETIRNNTSYSVVRIRNALFPLVSKKNLTIPAVRISAIARSPGLTGLVDPFSPSFMKKFLGTEEEVHLATKAHEIEVRELPPVPVGAKLWKALSPLVGKTSISIQYDNSPIAAGAPKDIRVIVETSGNINVISSLPISESDLYQSYENSPQVRKFVQNGLLWFKKEFSLTIVPNYGGNFHLDPFSITYFDPEKEEYQTASSEPIDFDVSGPQPPTTQQSVKESSSVGTNRPKEELSDESESQELNNRNLLYLGIGLCLLAFGYFVGNFSKNRIQGVPLTEIESPPLSLESASDAYSLVSLFEEWLRYSFPELSESSSVRYGIRSLKIDSDIKFEIESVLDEIDELIYGPIAAGREERFIAVKKSSINLIERIRTEDK